MDGLFEGKRKQVTQKTMALILSHALELKIYKKKKYKCEPLSLLPNSCCSFNTLCYNHLVHMGMIPCPVT